MKFLVFGLLALAICDLSFCAPNLAPKSENAAIAEQSKEADVAQALSENIAIVEQPEEADDVHQVQLLDVADAGGEHANEADRNARLIGFGVIGGYGYRPWGYRPWGYGYGYPYGGYGHYGGYRRWGGYYRRHYGGGWNYWG